MKLSEIWFEQCEAARDIEFEFGVPQALDYLIGEKFVQFVEAAGTDADFREELPAFIAEIKTIFEPWQLAEYLDKARQKVPFSAGPDEEEDDDEDDEDDTDEFMLLQNSNNLVFLELARELLIGD